MSHADPTPAEPAERLHGVLAEFTTPAELKAACTKVRDAGYTVWDAHTPHPIHGLDDCIGIKPTRLPWFVFCAGITGFSVGMGLQYFTNAVDYPFQISGKPLFGWPAAAPVAFELTILFSALTTLFTMLALNGLPKLFNPVMKIDAFRKATSHRYFIAISARDPKFSESETPSFLKGLHTQGVATVMEPSRAPVPKYFHYVAAVATCFALVPAALIYRARATTSESPKIHLVLDMDFQQKFKAQQKADFFSDKSAARPKIENTIARGEPYNDLHLTSGKVNGQFAAALPASVPVNEATMAQGQKMFNIYCSACHGYGGLGNGMVHQRAVELQDPAWVPPTNLTGETTRKMPDGQLFDAITNGIRNMAGYGTQIEAKDRWAIVLYVRALQRQQNAVSTASAAPVAAPVTAGAAGQ